MTHGSRHLGALLTSLLLGGAGLVCMTTPVAAAQGIDCDNATGVPCALDLARDGVQVQKAPTMFKFQARVAQRKMPSGDGTFSKLIVRLRDGATAASPVLCTETFQKVRVRDSVLNLDIGRKVDCELDEVLAERAALWIELCIKTTGSCLPPVQLPAVPYAMRATFANQAVEAQHANIAAQAGYAHRLTADRDLFLRKISAATGLGLGFLDFHGPTAAPSQAAPGSPALLPAALYDELVAPGWILWSPLRWAVLGDARSWVLHLAARVAATGGLTPLARLVVLASETHTAGRFVVETRVGQSRLSIGSGGAEIHGDVNTVGDVKVAGSALLEGDLIGLGGGLYEQPVVVDGRAHVTGGSASLWRLDVNAGGLDVTGASTTGALTVIPDAAATPGDDELAIKGDLTVTESVISHLGLQTGGGTSMVRADGATLALGQVGGADFNRIVVRGAVHITGDAVIEAPAVVTTLQSTATCPAGFGVTLNGTCADIDECAENLDNCAPTAICTNKAPADGRFVCTCPAGTRGNPTSVCGKGIFATSAQLTGNMQYGGKVGWGAAHKLCNDEAAAAGVGGTWVPFLGVGAPESPWQPADHLGDTRYVRMGDFLQVAVSKAALLDGGFDFPIDKLAGGATVDSLVWAGATLAGVAQGQTCSGWTSTGGVAQQYRVNYQLPFKYVTACSSAARVLCVEL